MKRAMMILLTLILWAQPVMAEAFERVYWTSKSDIYYHVDESCGSPEYSRVAVSVEAAEEFDRQPCPICVSPTGVVVTTETWDDDFVPEGILCIERGGTWVFRVPGAALAGLAMTGTELPEGAKALLDLFGESMSDALDARIAVPADGSLFMSLRVMDGDAFVVTRPKRRYKAKRPFSWQGIHVMADIFKPGEYTVEGVSGVWEYPPEKSGKPKKTFSEHYSGRKLEIDVYAALDAYVAVLRRSGGTDEDDLTGFVTIGEQSARIPVKGYVDKKEAVFCFILTEAELQALEDGAVPSVEPRLDVEPELVADVPDLSGDVAGEPVF